MFTIIFNHFRLFSTLHFNAFLYTQYTRRGGEGGKGGKGEKKIHKFKKVVEQVRRLVYHN